MKKPKQTKVRSRFARALQIALLSVCIVGCSAGGLQAPSERLVKARAMFEERCKSSGEKIYKTVDNVEGIYLLKVRPEHVNYENQFALDDPYGLDSGGDGYIGSFLRGSYRKPEKVTQFTHGYLGYLYVEAVDDKDAKRYRYTGRLEEPWQHDKSYLKGYVRFVVDRTPAPGNAPRYGVTYEDISTHEDREYWIAGSSLKVVDLQTSEVIGERVGYMIDEGQGNTSGGRAPWLLAANHSCPQFLGQHASSDQIRQTARFVEKVLKPKVDGERN